MAEPLSDLPLARASTLVEQVHRELRERILDGRLEPGSEVPDSVIARQMGVSRAPVRDACNLLVQSGLLTKQQNYPYRVRDFSVGDIGELQLIRYGYEMAAARQLVRTGQTPVDVHEPLERMTEAFRSSDAAMSGQADIDFHLALVRASGLSQLIYLHEAVMTQVSVIMRDFPLFVLATQRQRHQEILDALDESQKAGRPEALLGILSVHLLTSRADVEANEALQNPPEVRRAEKPPT